MVMPADGMSSADPGSGPFTRRERSTFQRFPLEALPPLVRRFTEEASRALGCDPTYVALPLLSALGSAIGNSRRIELKRGWCEPPILWTAIIGDSGSMKTPAFKCALAAFREIQQAAYRRHELEMHEWQIEKRAYDVAFKAWKSSSADGTSATTPPEEPPRPVADRYQVMDTTVEALVPILASNPRGVLLARDELAGWFGSFDRYAKGGRGGADSAQWLSMHSGEQIVIDRKTGGTPMLFVPSACVSICGGIQPGVLRRSLGQQHRESGMAARLLFAMPPRTAKSWTEAELSREVEKKVRELFEYLLALEPARKSPSEWTPLVLTLSENARRMWRDFYNEHAPQLSALEGDEAAAYSKIEGYAARLALIDHVVRSMTDAPNVSDGRAIEEVSLESGIVLARWFGAEALRVYEVLDEPDSDGAQRRLLDWIERNGGTATANEVSKGLRRYRSDAEGARAALTELDHAGFGTLAEVTPSARGGRPTLRFILGSTVTNTPDAGAASGGFGDGDSSGGTRLGHQSHPSSKLHSESSNSCRATTIGLHSDDGQAPGCDQIGSGIQWQDPVPDCKGIGHLGGTTLPSDQSTARNDIGNGGTPGDLPGPRDQGGPRFVGQEGEVIDGS